MYYTDQQLFDKVAKHLLTQNVRSEGPEIYGSCMYRSDRGLKSPFGCLKCAAGCLIPDEAYRPDMEGKLVESVWGVYKGLPYLNQGLLAVLQKIHDQEPVESWRVALRELASKHGLCSDVLGECP